MGSYRRNTGISRMEVVPTASIYGNAVFHPERRMPTSEMEWRRPASHGMR
jgi:hypothetical protein